MTHAAKPVVFIDVDDTISDTAQHLLGYINAKRERPYAFDELTPDFREGKREGKEYNSAIKELLRPEIIKDTVPYPDTLASLKRLHDAGYEIHIVSARRELLHDTTLTWLQQHGFIDFIEHIHPRPDSMKGDLFKHQLAKQIKPVALFDDTLDVALKLADVVDTVFLIDKPWNNGSDISLPPNVLRTPDFVAAVDQLVG